MSKKQPPKRSYINKFKQEKKEKNKRKKSVKLLVELIGFFAVLA
jgi:hypothetical protein